MNILNYLLFYSGEIPDYINQTLDSIFKVEDEACKVYFCGDYQLKRKDVEFININDLHNIDNLLTLFTLNFLFSGILNVPEEYSTIQLGIVFASEGDTVLVAGGDYQGDGNFEIDSHSI